MTLTDGSTYELHQTWVPPPNSISKKTKGTQTDENSVPSRPGGTSSEVKENNGSERSADAAQPEATTSREEDSDSSGEEWLLDLSSEISFI